MLFSVNTTERVVEGNQLVGAVNRSLIDEIHPCVVKHDWPPQGASVEVVGKPTTNQQQRANLFSFLGFHL